MSHHAIHLHGYFFKVVATEGGEIPPAGQWPEATVHVPTGSTRTIEFTANEPGDWVLHCHMLHHSMTQMGHHFGNVIGMSGPGKKIQELVPGYMAMGETGMGDMAVMGMANPANSLPMVGGQGQYDVITMGGMFTIFKVRDELPADGSDPAWYPSPAGTRADTAAEDDLRRDGIAFPAATARAEARSRARNGQPLEICAPATLVAAAGSTLKPNARVRAH